MTIQKILTFPDPGLRAVAEPITSFDADLRTLITDLLETMRDAQGIGIAATHIGVAKRLALVQLTPEDEVKTYINPEVIWASETLSTHKEGSVSMQGVVEDIARPASVRVRFQDADGATHTEEVDGLLSVCLQHEIDQLDGIFWLQKLSRLKKDRVVKRYEKLLRYAQTAEPQAT